MKPTFRATDPADLPKLQEFLRHAFPSDRHSPLWRDDVMRWKFWEPRPDWEGSRSFIVERDNHILAHGAAWPMRLTSASGSTPGFFFYDWAADPGSPGMGAAVLEEMCAAFGLAWLCGGTEEAGKMWSATGFHAVQSVSIHALPLRPFRMEVVRRQFGWKSARRLIQNQVRASLAPRPDRGWEAVAVEPSSVPALHGRPTVGFPSSLEFAGYYSRCPHADVTWHEVRRHGKACGFFTLVVIRGSARLAEAVLDRRNLDGGDAAGWKNVLALAAEVASSRGCHEIIAWASLPELRSGLSVAGFQLCGQQDLMVCGTEPAASEAEIDMQLVHGDMAFYDSGSPWYLC